MILAPAKSGICSPSAASYRMALPPGYALFAHHKPNSTGGAERIDVYLRVGSNA